MRDRGRGRQRGRERDTQRDTETERHRERQRHRETQRDGERAGTGRRQPGGELGAGRGLEERGCACLPSSETHQGKPTGIYSGNHRLLGLLFYHFADAITEPYPLSGKLEMSFPE